MQRQLEGADTEEWTEPARTMDNGDGESLRERAGNKERARGIKYTRFKAAAKDRVYYVNGPEELEEVNSRIYMYAMQVYVFVVSEKSEGENEFHCRKYASAVQVTRENQSIFFFFKILYRGPTRSRI